jgi:hypothetical protein
MKNLLQEITAFIMLRLLLVIGAFAYAGIFPINGNIRRQTKLLDYTVILCYCLIGLLLFKAPVKLRNLNNWYYMHSEANAYPEADVGKIPEDHLCSFLYQYEYMRPVWDGEYVTTSARAKWLESQGITFEDSDIPDRPRRFKCKDAQEFDRFLKAYGKMTVPDFLKFGI